MTIHTGRVKKNNKIQPLWTIHWLTEINDVNNNNYKSAPPHHSDSCSSSSGSRWRCNHPHEIHDPCGKKKNPKTSPRLVIKQQRRKMKIESWGLAGNKQKICHFDFGYGNSVLSPAGHFNVLQASNELPLQQKYELVSHLKLTCQ